MFELMVMAKEEIAVRVYFFLVRGTDSPLAPGNLVAKSPKALCLGLATG
jgi:hypothetical protein